MNEIYVLNKKFVMESVKTEFTNSAALANIWYFCKKTVVKERKFSWPNNKHARYRYNSFVEAH